MQSLQPVPWWLLVRCWKMNIIVYRLPLEIRTTLQEIVYLHIDYYIQI